MLCVGESVWESLSMGESEWVLVGECAGESVCVGMG